MINPVSFCSKWLKIWDLRLFKRSGDWAWGDLVRIQKKNIKWRWKMFLAHEYSFSFPAVPLQGKSPEQIITCHCYQGCVLEVIDFDQSGNHLKRHSQVPHWSKVCVSAVGFIPSGYFQLLTKYIFEGKSSKKYKASTQSRAPSNILGLQNVSECTDEEMSQSKTSKLFPEATDPQQFSPQDHGVSQVHGSYVFKDQKATLGKQVISIWISRDVSSWDYLTNFI